MPDIQSVRTDALVRDKLDCLNLGGDTPQTPLEAPDP
jgi:hypothetical protein